MKWVLFSVFPYLLAAQQIAPGPGDVAAALRRGGVSTARAAPSSRAAAKSKPRTTIKGDITGDPKRRGIDIGREPISVGTMTADYFPGQPLPNIPCTVGRLCEILLEPGEIIPNWDKPDAGAPILADSFHWSYSLRVAGAGKDARLAVVTKVVKQPVGLGSTDLLITTDRRDYHLTLVYDEQNYVPRFEFRYPADDARRAVLAYTDAQLQKTHLQALAAAIPEKFENRQYRLIVPKQTPGRMVPKSVSDDGTKTYLEFSPDILQWDAPTLAVAGPNGCEIVNWIPGNGPRWTVYRLFDAAELTLGTGRHAKRVRIERSGPGALATEATCQKRIKGREIDLSQQRAGG